MITLTNLLSDTGLFQRIRMRWFEIVVFSITVGALSTFVHGYFYGDVDQQEQLPLIMRQSDPSFLKNDYMVNAMSEFSARIYYAPLLAQLSKVVSLPTLFLLLTVLQHVLVVVVTFYTCRKMFRSDAAAIIGSIMVVSVFGPSLGRAAYLYASYLTPRTLMLFLALGSIWAGILGRTLMASAFAILGSFIQPQLALLAGCLGIGVAGVSLLLGFDARELRTRREILMKLGAIAVALSLLALFNYIFWYLPSKGGELSMESLQFLTTSYWPSGMMPSSFQIRDYLFFTCFIAATAFLWKWWSEDETTDQMLALRIALTLCIVLVTLAAGYVFTAIIPTRLFLSLQVFRLVLVVKWFGLMLLGGITAKLLLNNGDKRKLAAPALWLTAVGVLQPAIILIGVAVEFYRRKLAPNKSSATFSIVLILAILLQLSALFAVRGLKEQVSIFLCLTASLGFLFLSKLAVRVAAPILALVLTTLLVSLASEARISVISKFLERPLGKGISTDFHGDPSFDEVTEFAMHNTPEESVFLTPPDFGRFRLLAKRAILTDWRMVPFREKDVIEWRKRLRDAYGPWRGSNIEALKAMEQYYLVLSDADVVRLARDYGLTYAVLHRETNSTLPVLFENDEYKVVEIPTQIPLVRESELLRG